jgi:hypothetical protein
MVKSETHLGRKLHRPSRKLRGYSRERLPESSARRGSIPISPAIGGKVRVVDHVKTPQRAGSAEAALRTRRVAR